MKSNFFIEFQGTKVNQEELVLQAKNVWKDAGNKVKDIKTLDVYYKPEENMCYYVFNDDFSGSFPV